MCLAGWGHSRSAALAPHATPSTCTRQTQYLGNSNVEPPTPLDVHHGLAAADKVVRAHTSTSYNTLQSQRRVILSTFVLPV